MRRTGIVAVVVIGVMASGTLPAAADWRPGTGRAERYIGRRAGSVSFAVKTPKGRLFAYRGQTVVPAASVLKAMFMAAYLRSDGVRGRKLRRSDKDLLAPMIKRSDNATATRIADTLGPGPMYRLAGDAGMEHFTYTRPWGLSEVTATGQARYFFRYEDYIPRRHERYARYLLANVVGPQRWGIGRVKKPNWKKYFKGGWGSGTGAVCHQVAWLEREGKRIAVAVMITNSPDHTYAKRTLRGVFRRLLRDLPKP